MTSPRIFARWVSVVFDPVVVIPLALVATIVRLYLLQGGWLLTGSIVAIDLGLPAAAFLILEKKKRFKDWDFRRRGTRLPLLLLTLVSQVGGVFVAILLDSHPLAEWLIVIWFLVAMFTALTMYWKVSLHIGVLATIASFLTLTFGWRFGWMWLIVMLVAWARVVDKDHTVWQVVVGALIPITMIGSAGGVIK